MASAPRPNHLIIWTVAIGLAGVTVALASRSLSRLGGMGLPAESVAIVQQHPALILSIEGALLAGIVAFLLYRRGTFVIAPPPVASELRDEDGHRYVPLAWVTRGRIAFGDAFFDREGLYLVAYGDESAAEAAASKMGSSGGKPLIGGAALRERASARNRVIEAGRRALLGQTLGDRVMSRVGSARFSPDEILSFTYGKWLGSKLLTNRGLIIVQDITPDDAAALQAWIASIRP